MKYRSTLFAGFALALTTGCGQAEQTPQSATAQTVSAQPEAPEAETASDPAPVETATVVEQPKPNSANHGEFDILGLRLGMSQQEIDERFAELISSEQENVVGELNVYENASGIRNLPDEEHYAGHILKNYGRVGDRNYYEIRSIPDQSPGTGEAIGIFRTYGRTSDKAPSYARYRDALVAQQGEPSALADGPNGTKYYVWAADGVPENCYDVNLLMRNKLEQWVTFGPGITGYRMEHFVECGEMLIIKVGIQNYNGTDVAIAFEQYLVNPKRLNDSYTTYNEHWTRVVQEQQAEAADSVEVPL
jgi:hypothetical protein